MAIARDWTKTLFAASYKGVAFKVERDNEKGRRRIVEHEFPNRDLPFLEDLGEGVRHYTVTAYVASGNADAEANSVMAICAQRGPGLLILPTFAAPVMVRCLDFERDFERDRMGYSAIQLKFTREGFGFAIATVASLANMIFVRTGEAVSAIAASFAAHAVVKDAPDYVAAAVSDGVQTGLATLEATRTTRTIDSTASATQRDTIAATFDTVADVVASEDVDDITATAASVVEIAIALGDGMPATVAVAAFEEIITTTPVTVAEPVGSVWKKAVATNTRAGYTLLRLAAFAAYCEGIARLTLSDRQAGITLRANVMEYFEEQLGSMNPHDDYAIYVAVVSMRNAVIEYLSQAITTLVPVVPVSANLMLPSLWWSWRLYKDPTRAMEIVDRNSVPHPSFMPTDFNALVS